MQFLFLFFCFLVPSVGNVAIITCFLILIQTPGSFFNFVAFIIIQYNNNIRWSVIKKSVKLSTVVLSFIEQC